MRMVHSIGIITERMKDGEMAKVTNVMVIYNVGGSCDCL